MPVLPLLVEEDVTHYEHQIKAHPLGVRPSGNAFTASVHIRENLGIFSSLPDKLILALLEWLHYDDLLRLGSTCRAFFAFTACDDLWKRLFLQQSPSRPPWLGSWRATYLQHAGAKIPPFDCQLYSDALYRPFLCSQLNLAQFVSCIPLPNCIPRFANLSQADYLNCWNNRPFILTEPVKEWPIFSRWCQETLLDQYADVEFRAEAVDWPLKIYVEYMSNNGDESPLYLFDKDFVEKMNLVVEGNSRAYWPPQCFGEDLFALLGGQRPDSRWLIIGPERGGSTFHKDPNATSAWNAVIRGSKYWIMFPGSTLPPGVFVSEDQSEVTSPLSIAEWLLTFHKEARSIRGCIEAVCKEGEVLHVPSGWWHLVVNLEPAIAITQNFISHSHLECALEFLGNRPDQVSGFCNEIKNPHQLFLNALKQHGIEAPSKQSAVNGTKRKWEQVLMGEEMHPTDGEATFSFGFANDTEEENG
jgi:hypothetical protein